MGELQRDFTGHRERSENRSVRGRGRKRDREKTKGGK